MAKYRAENGDKARAAVAACHAEKGREYGARKRALHPERIRAQKAASHIRHSAKIIEKVAAWRRANPEKRRANARAEAAKRRSTPKGRLDGIMATAMSRGLIRGGKARRTWQSLVGYDINELMRHLERQFSAGMSWANYGEWHVDHIIPKAAFNYSLPEHADFKRCWALSNLRPLWARDNLVKGSKLPGPFQPSLAL